MCRATTCRVCGKTTWSGCGQHVAQVKAGVPKDQWCSGHDAFGGGRGGWFGRLIGSARR